MTLVTRGGSAHRVYSVTVFVILAALDNVAIGLVPPLVSPISQALGTREAAIGLAVSVSYLVTAVAAVAWAYAGDRTRRRPLLALGTVLWGAGALATAAATGWWMFLGAQVLAAIGLGAVSSVGFSVVTDLVQPRRRGLVLSLWGLSQGVGTLAGTLLAGLLGAGDWRRPFVVITVVGFAATAAYLLTYDVPRGASEPELAGVFAAGKEYEHRIGRDDLPGILRRRTNVWLVMQGLTAQVAFGSLVWLPRLLQAKAEQIGYSQSTAIAIGAVFATLFQLGGVLSIVGGLLGDRLQRRRRGGRALVAAVGILAAVPFYVVLFFVPLRVDVPDGAGGGEVVVGVLRSVVTEPLMAVSFLTALLALALTSANSPNWFALITEVNPPEHRGTVYSLGNLVNGVGRAAGNALVGATFGRLAQALPPPANYAAGLALFQVFFIPTGIMYLLAARSAGADTDAVSTLLRERGNGRGSGGEQVDALAEPQQGAGRLVGSHVEGVRHGPDDL